MPVIARFKTVTTIIVLLLLPAAAIHSRQPGSADSSNFDAYFDKILIKINASSQTDEYMLTDKTGSDLKLVANNEYKVSISLDYEFLGFSYGFSPKLFEANNDDVLKGRSSFTNYKFQFFPGQWLQTLSYDKTRGYYIENSEDFLPGWQKGKDPYLQIFNLKNVQWAMSTFYVFNPDFSFKNLIYQTQWQKKSAGSLVPALYYDYNRYSFDFGGIDVLQKDFNLRLGIGYYYTFIIAHRFYIAPNIVPSLGVRFSNFRRTEAGITERSHNTYFTRFLEGGLKFGYNSKRWVAGGGLTFNVNWYNENTNTIVENNKLYGILYLGFRFGTPKIVTGAYKSLSSKLP